MLSDIFPIQFLNEVHSSPSKNCAIQYAQNLIYILISQLRKCYTSPIVRQQYKEAQSEYDQSEEDLKSLQSGVGQVSCIQYVLLL